jgi:hypothetical protein
LVSACSSGFVVKDELEVLKDVLDDPVADGRVREDGADEDVPPVVSVRDDFAASEVLDSEAEQPGARFTNVKELFLTRILNAILNRLRIVS